MARRADPTLLTSAFKASAGSVNEEAKLVSQFLLPLEILFALLVESKMSQHKLVLCRGLTTKCINHYCDVTKQKYFTDPERIEVGTELW